MKSGHILIFSKLEVDLKKRFYNFAIIVTLLSISVGCGNDSEKSTGIISDQDFQIINDEDEKSENDSAQNVETSDVNGDSQSGDDKDDSSNSDNESEVVNDDETNPENDQETPDSEGNDDGNTVVGCGKAAPDKDETYVKISVTSGDKTQTRQFWISIPADYNPNKKNRLIVGLHGRDYSGVKMKDYLGLEAKDTKDNEIFVYPDALKRYWEGWNVESIGWQLGPGAENSAGAGMEDVDFMYEMVIYMKKNYCIDNSRIFATGQSWGGDFSNVVGCAMGDIFRAVVPVAANGDYYLTSPRVACTGHTAVWAMHGKADPYFSIETGEKYRDFWINENSCSQNFTDLNISTAKGEIEYCVEYDGCSERTLYCNYHAEFNHQIPWDYYAEKTMEFFRSF